MLTLNKTKATITAKVAAWREFTFVLHIPAGGTGKAGYFEAFTFTNTAIKLNAIFCENGAALFWCWRGKTSI
jgi:hypothetical protein